MSNWITLSQNSGTSGITTISVTADTAQSARTCEYKVRTNNSEKEATVVFVETDDSPYLTVYYNATALTTQLTNLSMYYDGEIGHIPTFFIERIRIDNGSWETPPYSKYYEFNSLGLHRVDFDVRNIVYSGQGHYDYKADYLANNLFKNVKDAVSAIVPRGFKTINDYVFSGCTSLSSATFSETITGIGGYVFKDSGINSFVFPPLCTYVNVGLFSGCSSLSGVVLTDNIQKIGEDAFYNCSSLTNIAIPESVLNIDTSAFQGCSSLEAINLPYNLTYLGQYAFAGCSAATGTITIPASINRLQAYVFSNCQNITNIIIPYTVKKIENRALQHMHSITSLNLPGVVDIGQYSIAWCYSLSSLTLSSELYNIGSYALWSANTLSAIFSNARIAPTITTTTLRLNYDGSAPVGTLHYPVGSDYSLWLSNGQYYLGRYGWTGVEDL